MKNWLPPTIIIVLLVAVAVWVIKSEGEKSREAMRQLAKQQEEVARNTVRQGIKEGVGDLIDEAKNAPGQVLDVLGGFLPKSKSKSDEADAPKDGKSPDATPRERTKPTELVSKAFQFVRDAAKAADDAGQEALALDTQEEIELGKDVRKTFSQHFKFAERPTDLERIQRLAAPVLERRNRKQIEYTFAIVDDASMNAFSILGGSIYVHTGLLDRLPSDAELQGVLAHEIGHVDLKHCVRSFTYAVRTGEIGGELADGLTKVAYRSLSVAYSEDHEFEADEFGFRTLVKAGVSREDSLAFTKFLLKAEDEAGVKREGSKPKTVFDSIGREVSNHYRTHPPATERLHRLERLKIEAAKP